MKLRIKFTKTGPMKFIGHLDMMRYFQKAIRRTDIDIAYSSGYSPHQIMSFAAPLGVGLESYGEYFDIEVHTMTTTTDIMMQLQATMAEGVDIVSVSLLPDTVGNAMASVAAAKYLIRFREGHAPSFDWKSQLAIFYQKPDIIVQKQTKKSLKEFNLRPFLYELKIEQDAIMMLVDASSSDNVKPRLVIEAFYAEYGQTLGEFDLEITRIETYTQLHTTGERSLVPLDAIGQTYE
ncbi:MAG: TIGR03936 family radical SAM-associated protein [Lachnospiraceae bacterium]